MDEKILDLGHLKGKVLVFGGVYGNLQALERLVEIADSMGISPGNCLCTGDLTGYCAQPEESIQLFRKWGAKSIAGNVEVQLREDAENCGCEFVKGGRCENFSKNWYPFVKSQLSKSSLGFIEKLPDHIKFQLGGKKVFLVHGSYFNVSEYIFKSTPWKKKQDNFTASKSEVIVAGHCGLPFHQGKEGFQWLNPGAIGLPANDGSTKVWCAVLEEGQRNFKFSHLNFEYDHELAAKSMLKNNLPKEYALSLSTGIWDNTEILPPEETTLQGKGIEF